MMSTSDSPDVGIFLPSLRGGGTERIMVAVANELTKRGLGADLIVAKATGPYLGHLESGVRLVDLKAGRMIHSLVPLARHLRQAHPKVLFSALNHANIVAILARMLSLQPIRHVVSVRNIVSIETHYSPNRRQRLIPHLIRLLYPHTDAIVAVSHAVADDLARVGRLSLDQIRVIYNPINTDDLVLQSRASINHPWFADGATPIILGTGRLAYAKDFSTLVRAFYRVREKLVAKLVILGEGETRVALEGLVQKMDLQKDVWLPGFVSNPFAYMAKAAVFVLSSRWEGFGNVLVEAMACGTPIVCTDCPGGPSEILERGKFGRLVPVGDDRAMADAILETLEKPLKPEQLRGRAADFSMERIIGQIIEVLFDRSD